MGGGESICQGGPLNEALLKPALLHTMPTNQITITVATIIRYLEHSKCLLNNTICIYTTTSKIVVTENTISRNLMVECSQTP